MYLVPHRKNTTVGVISSLFCMSLTALQKAIFVSFYSITYTGLNQVPSQNTVLLVCDKCQTLSHSATKTPEHTTVYLFFLLPPWI